MACGDGRGLLVQGLRWSRSVGLVPYHVRSAAWVLGYCRHQAGRVRDRIARRWQLRLALGSVAGAARPGCGLVRIGRRWQLRPCPRIGRRPPLARQAPFRIRSGLGRLRQNQHAEVLPQPSVSAFGWGRVGRHRIVRRWQLRLALGSVAGSPAPGWCTLGSSTASDHRIVGWTVAVAVVDWSPSWLTRLTPPRLWPVGAVPQLGTPR